MGYEESLTFRQSSGEAATPVDTGANERGYQQGQQL